MHRRNHGKAVLTAQAIDEFERLLLVADVKRARRLVKQQHGRLLRQRAGDHQALPLAARQSAERAARKTYEV